MMNAAQLRERRNPLAPAPPPLSSSTSSCSSSSMCCSDMASSGSDRVASALLGNQVTFGGLGEANGWALGSATTAAAAACRTATSGGDRSLGFSVFQDQENVPPPMLHHQQQQRRSSVSAVVAKATTSALDQQRKLRHLLNQENVPPPIASAAAAAGPYISSAKQLAAAATGGGVGASGGGGASQRRRHQQQRKQKLRQRPLQPIRQPLRGRQQQQQQLLQQQLPPNQRRVGAGAALPFGIYVDDDVCCTSGPYSSSTTVTTSSSTAAAAARAPLRLPSALLAPPSSLAEAAASSSSCSVQSSGSDTPSGSLHSSFESSLSIVSGHDTASACCYGGGAGVSGGLEVISSQCTSPAIFTASSSTTAAAVASSAAAVAHRQQLLQKSSPVTGSGSLQDVFEYREYAADAYRVMRNSELKHRAKVGFMARQPDITLAMRTILIDWLVEVNDEYKMAAESLHLAVNYIDRFLSVMTVVRSKLQLVGTTALFIASKFEEIYPPTAVEFVYITDDTYTVEQLRLMEHIMLKMLAFDLAVPTASWFLSYYCCHSLPALSDAVKHLAQYLSELCLVQYEICNRYLCSQQAAAALSLALQTSDLPPWSQHLVDLTGYSLSELRPCIEETLVVFQMASSQPQQAVVDKFASDKYSAVSTVTPPSHCRWY